MKLYKGKKTIIKNVIMADTFMSRLVGLLGRDDVPTGFAMYFPACNLIHTFFMRTAIDVIMTDDKGRVTKVFAGLKPWKTAYGRGAKNTIELGAGEAKRLGIRAKDTISLK